MIAGVGRHQAQARPWLRLRLAKQGSRHVEDAVCLTNGLITSHGSTPKPTVASVLVSCTIHGC
jgi:hypothetical protein